MAGTDFAFIFRFMRKNWEKGKKNTEKLQKLQKIAENFGNCGKIMDINPPLLKHGTIAGGWKKELAALFFGSTPGPGGGVHEYNQMPGRTWMVPKDLQSQNPAGLEFFSETFEPPQNLKIPIFFSHV